MDTKEIKKLLMKGFDIVDIVNKCRTSINEVSFSTNPTISLTDLKNNIDFEIFPELEFLFSKENIAYLKPFYGKLMGLEDNDLGIVKRDIVVAEMALLLGVDLTLLHTGSSVGMTSKWYINYVKPIVGELAKPIVYFDEVLDIRLLLSNNKNIFSEDKDYTLYYKEKENVFKVVFEKELANGEVSRWGYDCSVYFLLRDYKLSGIDVCISNEILNQEMYSTIKPYIYFSLEDSINRVISNDFVRIENDKISVIVDDNSDNVESVAYFGNKDKDTISSVIANEFRKIINGESSEFAGFCCVLSHLIGKVCYDGEVEELFEYFDVIYANENDDESMW